MFNVESAEWFESELNKMLELHRSKAHDYTSGSEFFNFSLAADMASMFENHMDKVFATMIGIKLSRIVTLLKVKDGPRNESLNDTFRDMAIYTMLWNRFHAPMQINDKTTPELRISHEAQEKANLDFLKRNFKANGL